MAAPEALNGEPICKSDIWSCGILMYIILSGQIPIFGTTIRRLRQKLSYCNSSLIQISQIFNMKALSLFQRKRKD